MDVDVAKALALGHVDEREQVGNVAVNAAVGEQAHQVQLAAVFLGLAAGVHKFGHLEEVAVLDGLGDAGQLLIDDAARADVEVAHLGVAHLSLGQAHIHAGGADDGVGIFGLERVDDGRAGLTDGVALAFRALAKAVQYDQCSHFLGHFIYPLT